MEHYSDIRLTEPVKFDKTIFIDQAGYRAGDKKIAVLTRPVKKVFVKNSVGDTVLSAAPAYFGTDSLSGDEVYRADFSALTAAGDYHIETDDGECSLGFKIADDVYDDCLKKCMRAFYYLRCGSSLCSEHAGKFTHAACHTEKALLWEDKSVSLDVSGGWHDAGDYGRYVTSAACAVSHLLNACRFFPERFKKLDLGIPESGGAMPDILCECKYELDWMLKMQRSDGGVYHKATTEHHAPFVMPEEDTAQLYVFPVSTMATADFAATAALAYTVYREYDERYAANLLSSAKLSWQYLEKHEEFIGFTNPEGVNTGGYGERDDKDNRFWAACELFAAVGEEKYHDALKTLAAADFPLWHLGYGSVGGLGALSYILCEHSDKALSDKMKSIFVSRAEEMAASADRCGYGAAMTEWEFCWGSNMNLLKNGMIFAIADIFEGGSRFKNYAAAQLHYLLGVNATGYSFVSGVGEFCIKEPHLRSSFADGIEECIPGMISGGPNRFPGDYAAKRFIPEGTPPMKCFADSVACYSLNEITIYWNSPAVFLLGALTDDPHGIDC